MAGCGSVLRQREVKLLLLQVGLGHHYPDRVAKLVFVVMASANEAVVALVEVVIVVVKVVHGHHALAVVLVDFAVYAV